MLPRKSHRRPSRDRVREAREFLRFLASSVREPQAGLGWFLAEEAGLLDGLPDEYVFHEHLDEVNQPVYFHQFVDDAAAHGLQYLWESYVGELGGDLPPEAILAAARAGHGPDRTAAIHRLSDRSPIPLELALQRRNHARSGD